MFAVCSTADPGTDSDDDEDLMSLSAGSRSATQCPAVSTDSDPTLAGCDQSSVKGKSLRSVTETENHYFFSLNTRWPLTLILSHPDVTWTDPVLGEPSVELHFQSESRAVSMKDLVREFIRKAHVVGLVCTNVCVVCVCKRRWTWHVCTWERI